MIFAQTLFLRCMRMLFGLLAFLSVMQAQAQVGADVSARARAWLDATLSSGMQVKGLPLRLEVSLGDLDARLQLAPCERIEPYLPVGTRLWGKTRLGLRCVQGLSKWNVFMPLTVKAFGPAWVIRDQVPSGVVLTESDAMAVEVDWAELNSPIIAERADWLGQTATRSLSTGQALRQDMVKAAQVFQAGAQVRVLAYGSGFEIATSAQAVSAGVLGQMARVRMDNGRIMAGVVLDSRTVRMAL
jgi:flagella basal body P-ring formation protein FlgA